MIRGEVIRNDSLLTALALEHGFVHEATLDRRMNDRKKAFHPSHGRIKEEKIVILRNAGAGA
jgi:hypothetical protein